MTKKKVYPPEFKAKIVRELVEGDDSVGVVAARHHLNANMISGWRKQLFDDAAIVFAQEQEIKKDREVQENHRQARRGQRALRVGKRPFQRRHPPQAIAKRHRPI